MAKEGYGILAALIGGALILFLGWKLTSNDSVCIMAVILVLFAIFCSYFFRDPHRELVGDDDAIVSPGDGRVVEISKVREDDYLQSEAVRIALFLSIFDVHISRVPIGGLVEFMQYRRGKFFPANSKRASSSNEQTIIGVQTKYGKILFSQIAGILARRIVCYLREGHIVETGERFGIIKFGSRMEIYLPEWATVTVVVGDKLKAGKTVIGRANEQ